MRANMIASAIVGVVRAVPDFEYAAVDHGMNHANCR